MCHADHSRPPAPPVQGEVAGHGPLELVSADGTHLAGYEARPGQPGDAGIVVLPDVRGLHPYYVALTQRFAEAGLPAVAIDYFGRTDGVAQRDESFNWQSAIQNVTAANVAADTEPAVVRLRDEHGASRVFTVGFCFGGSQSWRLAASDLGLAGVIGFYGRPSLVQDVAGDIKAPMLMLVAGADHATPVEESRGFAERLSSAGKDVEVHVYDGAPHSFFDRAYADWADACADAWRRILEFVSPQAGSGHNSADGRGR